MNPAPRLRLSGCRVSHPTNASIVRAEFHGIVYGERSSVPQNSPALVFNTDSLREPCHWISHIAFHCLCSAPCIPHLMIFISHKSHCRVHDAIFIVFHWSQRFGTDVVTLYTFLFGYVFAPLYPTAAGALASARTGRCIFDKACFAQAFNGEALGIDWTGCTRNPWSLKVGNALQVSMSTSKTCNHLNFFYMPNVIGYTVQPLHSGHVEIWTK